MKKLLASLILFAGSALAQQTFTVTLKWQDTVNPAGTQYNLYRKQGICTTDLTGFTKIAGPIAAMTYDDLKVNQGSYCYYATSVLDTLPESAPSPTAGVIAVVLVSPTSFSTIVKPN